MSFCPYWRLFAHADACLHHLARICPHWRLSVPTDACLPLLMPACPYWRLVAHTDSCLSLLTFVCPYWRSYAPIDTLLPILTLVFSLAIVWTPIFFSGCTGFHLVMHVCLTSMIPTLNSNIYFTSPFLINFGTSSPPQWVTSIVDGLLLFSPKFCSSIKRITRKIIFCFQLFFSK